MIVPYHGSTSKSVMKKGMASCTRGFEAAGVDSTDLLKICRYGGTNKPLSQPLMNVAVRNSIPHDPNDSLTIAYASPLVQPLSEAMCLLLQ